LIKETLEFARSTFTNLSKDMLRKAVVHRLVNLQVTDMISHCVDGLMRHEFSSASQAMTSEFRISPSPELAEKKKELETFLYERVYRHPELISVRQQAQDRLKAMYASYCKNPDFIPQHHRVRIEDTGVRRTAVDYIAGMTDKFCEDTYKCVVSDQNR